MDSERRQIFGKSVFRPRVVAECGANHCGDVNTALKMIQVAASCGADVVKFQKRDVEAIPHDVKDRPRYDDHAFGSTEYEHRKALEFPMPVHHDLKEACRKFGVEYACSAWDEKSYNQLVDLGVSYVKVPSAKNQEFQKWKREPNLPLHVSLGMLSRAEREEILARLGPNDVPYACTSKYPCRMEDVYLFELVHLGERFSRVGFSGHHNGIAVDLGAAMFGANYIERHFTLDRSAKGTDHAASLEPTGLLKLVRDIGALWKALQDKPEELPECEREARAKLKLSK